MQTRKRRQCLKDDSSITFEKMTRIYLFRKIIITPVKDNGQCCLIRIVFEYPKGDGISGPHDKEMRNNSMKRPVKDLTHDAEISISVYIIASVSFFFDTLRSSNCHFL